MEPHRCYSNALKGLFDQTGLHGMAHITGGGIPGNLNRILPKGTDAVIAASQIRILPVFKTIKAESGNDDADMIRTFNLGVGLTLVADPSFANAAMQHLQRQKIDCYPIGIIIDEGKQIVRMDGNLCW
jgi:phosphoribosylformylglycinamidine cyclo-ligase